jgi:hypothetical protein
MSVLVRPDCKIARVVGRPPDSEARKSDYLRTRHHEGEPRVTNTARPEYLPIHLRVTLKLALRVTPFETRALTAGRPPPDRYALFKVFAREFAAEWSRLQAEAGAHLSRARSERDLPADRSACRRIGRRGAGRAPERGHSKSWSDGPSNLSTSLRRRTRLRQGSIQMPRRSIVARSRNYTAP